MKESNSSTTRRFAPLGILFAILGLLLFAYFIRKAGVSEIVAGVSRLGAGFLLILALSAIRQVARSIAWIQCFEDTSRLRFRDAFASRIMGDALGNIVPLASVAISEPSKALFVRDRVPLLTGLAALALENIFYSLSVALFVFSGTAALLLSFTLPKPLRYAAIGALIATALIGPIGYLVIRQKWKFLSGTLGFVRNRGLAQARLEKTIPRAQQLEERIYGFYERNRSRILPIFLLEMCFHFAGVAEIYTTLYFISDVVAPTLLTAFILESVNRIINVAFKFVPFRTGVDEAGTGMLSKVLGFTTTIGVTLAIVRKARDICWTTLGIALIIGRGLSLRRIRNEAETIATEVSV